MKHFRASLSVAALSLAALFSLPFASFADELPALAVTNFNVVLKANTFRNAVAVGPGETAGQSASVTLAWDATGAKSCIGNWSAEPLSGVTGTVTGTIPLTIGSAPVVSRTFTIVCIGTGTAKSAKVTVTLAKADLAVSKLVISGLTPVTIQDGQTAKVKKNTFKVGNPAYSLTVTVKNTGKLEARSFDVAYQSTKTRDNPNSWQNMETKPVTAISPGVVRDMPLLPRAAAHEAGASYYFRACADSGLVIVEANENNNCSTPIGPFIFENQP